MPSVADMAIATKKQKMLNFGMGEWGAMVLDIMLQSINISSLCTVICGQLGVNASWLTSSHSEVSSCVS